MPAKKAPSAVDAKKKTLAVTADKKKTKTTTTAAASATTKKAAAAQPKKTTTAAAARKEAAPAAKKEKKTAPAATTKKDTDTMKKAATTAAAAKKKAPTSSYAAHVASAKEAVAAAAAVLGVTPKGTPTTTGAAMASVCPATMDRNYWLIKSEPFKWSWAQQQAVAQEHWDGVRNYQAAGNMKKMAIGDLAFFYHSNEGKDIVGIVQCVKEYYPDPTDDTGRGFGMVDWAAVCSVPNPVGLQAIKENAKLKDMALIRQGRLSVCPVLPSEWDIVCQMGGVVAPPKK